MRYWKLEIPGLVPAWMTAMEEEPSKLLPETTVQEITEEEFMRVLGHRAALVQPRYDLNPWRDHSCPKCGSYNISVWSTEDWNPLMATCGDCGHTAECTLFSPFNEEEEMEEQKGLYAKFRVYKGANPVDGCFVLRPENDPAAREALHKYADAVQETNPTLARDIGEWLNSIRDRESNWGVYMRKSWTDNTQWSPAVQGLSKKEATRQAARMLLESDGVYIYAFFKMDEVPNG